MFCEEHFWVNKEPPTEVLDEQLLLRLGWWDGLFLVVSEDIRTEGDIVLPWTTWIVSSTWTSSAQAVFTLDTIAPIARYQLTPWEC